MKFHPIDYDPESELQFSLLSKNKLVQMGVWRVMFGFRVRAGFYGEQYLHLDWCGGGCWSDVERLYSICLSILENRPEDRHCFEDLPPFSRIKPFYNDMEFVTKVAALAGDFELVSLDRSKILPLIF